MRLVLITLTIASLFIGRAWAGDVSILDVQVRAQQDGRYSFSVTLKHADNGWDHYADRWEVLAPGGAILGTRVLLHPHVAEQPFTRSQSGVVIPAGLKFVDVRAHDKMHGYGPKVFMVMLPGR